MFHASALEPDPHEPLALRADRCDADANVPRQIALEFSSRGDRVPASLLIPALHDGAAPAPVIVLAHGLGGSRASDYMQTARRWAREGVAVASIDFPLHGARANAKMSERLAASAPRAIRGEPLERVDEMLWGELARQSVLDLRRLVDALETLPEIDARRLAFVGFSLGGILGCLFCGADPRPRAAALAVAGSPPPGTLLALDSWVAQIAPRPTLFVSAEGDATIPREAAERLAGAGREPKQHVWFPGSHAELPGAALKQIFAFARAHLGV